MAASYGRAANVCASIPPARAPNASPALPAIPTGRTAPTAGKVCAPARESSGGEFGGICRVSRRSYTIRRQKQPRQTHVQCDLNDLAPRGVPLSSTSYRARVVREGGAVNHLQAIRQVGRLSGP